MFLTLIRLYRNKITGKNGLILWVVSLIHHWDFTLKFCIYLELSEQFIILFIRVSMIHYLLSNIGRYHCFIWAWRETKIWIKYLTSLACIECLVVRNDLTYKTIIFITLFWNRKSKIAVDRDVGFGHTNILRHSKAKSVENWRRSIQKTVKKFTPTTTLKSTTDRGTPVRSYLIKRLN